MRVTEDMEITVPKGATIEAHGRYGDFDVHDIDGALDITSEHAGVRLENLGGDARLDLTAQRRGAGGECERLAGFERQRTDLDLENIDGQVTINGAYSGAWSSGISRSLFVSRASAAELNSEELPGAGPDGAGGFHGLEPGGSGASFDARARHPDQ